jgi:hypothetical protein
MPKSWRWIAPIAVAGGLIASGAIPAADASPAAATTSITINATSPNYPGLRARDHGKVDGFALVVYKQGAAATAVISGNVTTTATDDMATLMAKPFGKSTYTAVGTPVSLTTLGVNTYSFSVKPSLATKYKVQVSGTDNGTSTPVAVYVMAALSVPPKYVHLKCTPVARPTRCVLSLRAYTTLPASALKTESRKHVYMYLAIGDPRPPKNYTLSTASRASTAKRVNSGKFWKTLTFIIPIRNSRTTFFPNACTKDTESRDGMGLPGHHGCGDRHVPRSAIYLG